MNNIAKLRQLVIFAWMMMASLPSYSLSCTVLRDRFFVQCVQGVCVKAFRALEVRTDGSCGRRVTVEDVPDTMVQYISKEIIKENAADNESRIFQILFFNRYYGKAPETVEELARNLQEKNPVHSQLKNIEVVTQNTDIELLRKKWLEQADRELLWTRIYSFIDIGGLVSGLILLVYTIVKYRNLTKDYFLQETYHTKIFKLLLTQTGLLVIGLIPWLIFLEGAVFIFLLAPLLILVWIYEILFYVYMRQLKR